MKNILKKYLQPSFLICVVILAAAGGFMSYAIEKFGVYLQKTPLPLTKSLKLLDESPLGNYKIVSKRKIENKEIVKSLGTEEYIQWALEDTTAPANSEVKRIGLFITYYDTPDRVPHVPEECYSGGGNQQLTSDNIEATINFKDGTKKVNFKHLVFSATNGGFWQRENKFSVLYLFKVNNIYGNSRDEARAVLGANLFKPYSYFSKVEWTFMRGSGRRTYPPIEQAAQASEKMLNVILPILESNHWPNWDEVN